MAARQSRRGFPPRVAGWAQVAGWRGARPRRPTRSLAQRAIPFPPLALCASEGVWRCARSMVAGGTRGAPLALAHARLETSPALPAASHVCPAICARWDHFLPDSSPCPAVFLCRARRARQQKTAGAQFENRVILREPKRLEEPRGIFGRGPNNSGDHPRFHGIAPPSPAAVSLRSALRVAFAPSG